MRSLRTLLVTGFRTFPRLGQSCPAVSTNVLAVGLPSRIVVNVPLLIEPLTELKFVKGICMPMLTSKASGPSLLQVKSTPCGARDDCLYVPVLLVTVRAATSRTRLR